MKLCDWQRYFGLDRKHKRLSLLCVVAITALTFSTAEVQAGIVTFFGIDQGNGTPPTTLVNSLAANSSFQSALGTVGVENFNSYSVNSKPSSLSFTGSGVTATATYSSDESINNTQDNGEFATSAPNYLDARGTRDDILVFSTAVAGVGFYITDLSDGFNPADQISIIATLVGGSTQTFTTNVNTNNNNANVLFFGIVSSGGSPLFSKVEIINTRPGVGDVDGLDDLTVGLSQNAVPEPSSFVLGLIGLVGIGCGWRRRMMAIA